MKYTASIDIMPQSEIIDPKGKLIADNLAQSNILNATKVALGKKIEIAFEADSETSAIQMIKDACEHLLVNSTTETYVIQITPDQQKEEEE